MSIINLNTFEGRLDATSALVGKRVEAAISGKTSDKYQPVDTMDLIRQVDQALRLAGVEADTRLAYSRQGASTAHVVTWTLDKQVALHGDPCQPRIMLRNSFGGECNVQLFYGFWRKVCDNGLVAGEQQISSRVRHIQGPLIEDFKRGFANSVEHLAGTLVNRPVDLIDPRLDQPVTYWQGRLVLIKLHREGILTNTQYQLADDMWCEPTRVEDSYRNLWCLYNQVNEAIEKASRRSWGRELKIFSKNTNLINACVDGADYAQQEVA